MEGKKAETLNFGELRFDDRAKENVAKAMERTYIAGAGPFVEEYEKKWGALFGLLYNTAMNSGTGADIVACKAIFDINPKAKRSAVLYNNQIIAPANAFVAVGSSIVDAGFIPNFVDIDRKTLNIDPDKIEEKINERTRAIMAVHTMGKPCDIDKICHIAQKHELNVIEDCCEAHGARHLGNYVGTFGDIATYSSYIAHLVCSVEGGMISTNNRRTNDVIRSLRNHGRKPDSLYFDHERLGGNYKMHDLEAAVGLAAIDRFWGTFNFRKANLEYVIENTKDLQEFAFMNNEEGHEVLCPHAFSIVLKDPKQFSYQDLYNYLGDNPIMNFAYYKRNFGSMPTQHKAFEFLGHKLGEFPEAEYVGDNGIHFGLHQYTTEEQLHRVPEVLHSFFKKFKK